jgi:hypothetical protein
VIQAKLARYRITISRIFSNHLLGRFSYTLFNGTVHIYVTKEKKEKQLAKPDSMAEDGGEEGE